MRLVFAGTPAVAVPALELLLSSPQHDVVGVVTRPDKPAGRGRTLAQSPVKDRAAAAGLEVLQPARPSEPAFLERLAELAPDCCPVVAYGALLPVDALAIPPQGWVNLHFSLLPAWRGAAPVQHAILHGDTVTGATTFRIEEGLDSGPVFGMLTTDIGPRETAGDLLSRLAVSGAGLLLATLDGIADGTLVARPQDNDGVSLAPKITVSDARIDWSTPALHVDRLVRACTPAPGAWTTFRDKRVKLDAVVPDSDDRAAVAGLAPGELVVAGRDVLAGTGSTPVVLGDVRPEGRSPMPASDWVRGLHLDGGERFR